MAPARFVVPKGSLEQATFKLLGEAWARVTRKERSYHVYLDDPGMRVRMMRPREIPTLVAEGLYDIGITGHDWVLEMSADVAETADLEYGRIKLVTAFPDPHPCGSLDGMLSAYVSDDMVPRVSAGYPGTASSFIIQCRSCRKRFGDLNPLIVTPWLRRGNNKMVQIHLSFGATGAGPPNDMDATLDATGAGTAPVQSRIKAADTVLKSSARLVCNKESLQNPGKREKMREMASLPRGAVRARRRLPARFNIHKDKLDAVLQRSAPLKGPAISPPGNPGWYAINKMIIRKDEHHSPAPQPSRLEQGLAVHGPRRILELYPRQ